MGHRVLRIRVGVGLRDAIRWSGSSTPYKAPRTFDGKPDISGIWQAVNWAVWDMGAKNGRGGAPGGLGMGEGGPIPNKPDAALKKKENFKKRATADPLQKCFLAGVPRVMYIPFPFQIIQTP